MAAGDAQGTIGKRLLVIAFALGIVMIGMQPIRSKYGDTLKAIKERTQAYAGPLKELRKLRDTSSPVAGTAPTVKKVVIDKEKTAEKIEHVHDGITPEDRKQLSKLIDDL